MPFILYFARINTFIASIFGIFANALLLYFMFFGKKVELKPLRKIFLQNSILDLFFSFLNLIASPEVVVFNNVYYIIVDGFLKKCSHVIASIFIVFICCCLLSTMYLMAVPFYFRYVVICQSQGLTIYKFFKVYGIIFIVFIISAIGSLLFFPPENEYYSKFTNIFIDNRLWFEHDGINPTFVATNINNPYFIFTFTFSSSIMIISYSALIYFCIKISRKLKDKNTVMHVKTKQINKQIHRVLIVQAIVPLLACNIPMLILFVMTFIGGNTLYTSICCSSILAWIPAANPLASLLIIKFYRQKIFSFYFKIIKKHNNIKVSMVKIIAVKERYQK